MSSSGIENNTILNCDVGIILGDACTVDIINNTITSCTECGIFNRGNYDRRRIYNNYFNNSLNVKFGPGEGGNIWNSSLASGSNIADGPYIGGNFWAKPDGTGFSQICVDLDRNGIGDLPYNIYENEFDYLPLVSMSSLQIQLLQLLTLQPVSLMVLHPLLSSFQTFRKTQLRGTGTLIMMVYQIPQNKILYMCTELKEIIQLI